MAEAIKKLRSKREINEERRKVDEEETTLGESQASAELEANQKMAQLANGAIVLAVVLGGISVIIANLTTDLPAAMIGTIAIAIAFTTFGLIRLVNSILAGGLLMLGLAFVGLVFWLVSQINNLFSVFAQSWLAMPIIFMVCMTLPMLFGRAWMRGGFELKKDYNKLAFWGLVGSLIFSVYFHFRFSLLGISIGILIASAIIVSRHVSETKGKIIAGAIVAAVFIAVIALRFDWLHTFDFVVINTNILWNANSYYWHWSSTLSTALCSTWTFWIWSKKIKLL